MYIVLQLGLMLWLPVLYYKVLHLHRLHAVTWKTIEFILLSEHTHSHTQKALSESWLNIIECISRNSTDIQYMIIINWGVMIRCFTTRIQPLLIQSLYSSTHVGLWLRLVHTSPIHSLPCDVDLLGLQFCNRQVSESNTLPTLSAGDHWSCRMSRHTIPWVTDQHRTWYDNIEMKLG